MTMTPKLTLCDHPLMQQLLGELRDKRTPPARFRDLMSDAGEFLACAALAELKLRPGQVQTPLKSAAVMQLRQPVALVAVLRAGLGFVPGISRLLPEAPIGHIGLYRNEETLHPVRYYVRLPKGLEDKLVLLLDPMLATGGSASESIHILKTDGAREIVLVTLLATRPGLARVHKDHPEVRVVTAAVDPVLNKVGYIVPGLGDAGDRLFGT